MQAVHLAVGALGINLVQNAILSDDRRADESKTNRVVFAINYSFTEYLKYVLWKLRKNMPFIADIVIRLREIFAVENIIIHAGNRADGTDINDCIGDSIRAFITDGQVEQVPIALDP